SSSSLARPPFCRVPSIANAAARDSDPATTTSDRPARRRASSAAPHRPPVHLLHPTVQTGLGEAEAVGGERVRDHDGRAGADVVLVYLAHDVRELEVRGTAPGRVVHRDAARLQLGAGGAVDDDDVAGLEAGE